MTYVDLSQMRKLVGLLWRVLLVCSALFILAPFESRAAEFSFQLLKAKAKSMAADEYQAQKDPELPEALRKLSYDDYQAIRFVPSHGPWQDQHLHFTFQFFHRGFIYQDPVRIHLVERGKARDFQFSPSQFVYPKPGLPGDLPPDLNFAGLRVLYPVNAAGKQDEVAAFLGASYFRLIGAHQGYGASARGLAIDTAEPTGEEFPRFTDFWIEQPGPLDVSARLYALLDSPSATGAYQFIIQPGEITEIDVEAYVVLRKEVKKLGVAPLTSMFLKGENHTRSIPDFRPEIHDSDGLLVETDGGWQWRPLINPEKQHEISEFTGAKMQGFGLLQRDRNFDHYQDLAGRYDLRPSLWIRPQEDWGTGEVELVEIPTAGEWNDNIVAYWALRSKAGKGHEFRWHYQISATVSDPEPGKLLRVLSTRITPGHDRVAPRFVVDFGSKNAPALPADAKIEASVTASDGQIRNLVLEKNEVTGGWRTFFDLAERNKPAEIRLFLHRGNEALSETWVYRYPPQ